MDRDEVWTRIGSITDVNEHDKLWEFWWDVTLTWLDGSEHWFETERGGPWVHKKEGTFVWSSNPYGGPAPVVDFKVPKVDDRIIMLDQLLAKGLPLEEAMTTVNASLAGVAEPLRIDPRTQNQIV